MRIIDNAARVAFVAAGGSLVAFAAIGGGAQTREWMEYGGHSPIELLIPLVIWGMFLTLGVILVRHAVVRAEEPPRSEAPLPEGNLVPIVATALTALAYVHALVFPASRIYSHFPFWALPSLAGLVALPVAGYFLFPYRQRSLALQLVVVAAALYPAAALVIVLCRLR